MSSPEHRPTRTFRVPGPTDVYVRRAQSSSVPLGALESQVLERIDGAASLAAVASGLGIAVREVAMVVARLSDLGAVEHELDAGWVSANEADTVPPPASSG